MAWFNTLFSGLQLGEQEAPIADPGLKTSWGWGERSDAENMPPVSNGEFTHGSPDARPCIKPSGYVGQAGPVEDKAAEAAAEVTELAKNKMRKAWKAFRTEVATLLSIWESVSTVMQSGIASGDQGLQQQREVFQHSIKEVLGLVESNPEGALTMLKSLLRDAQAHLNQATIKAADNVVKADLQSKHCLKLAVMLQSDPQYSQLRLREIEVLLKVCEFGSKSMEQRMRKGLGLDKEKEELNQQKAAQKAKILQLVVASGASEEHTKKVLENAGGNADSALTVLMSEKKAAAVKAEVKAKEKLEKKAKNDAKATQEKTADAKKTAATMSDLASSTQRLAWAQVQVEFDVQVNLWKNQERIASAQNSNAPSFAQTQSEIQGVLDSQARDPAGAVLHLERALQHAKDRGLQLCSGMYTCTDGLHAAKTIALNRQKLARKLGDVARMIEAGVPRKHCAADARELQTLVTSCQLKDASLGMHARMLLDPGNVSI